MTQAHQMGEDLQFVRQAIKQRERSRNVPTFVAWTVAIYVVAGYTLLDVRPQWAGIFFAAGGVAMGVLFAVFGKLIARQSGEYDRAEMIRLNLHWGSILLAIAGVIALGVTRHVDGQTIGQFIALAIGLIYFLGGVHFDRNLLWLGPAMMAGAIAITYVPHYGWTALGLVVGLGLVIPTLLRRKPLAA